MIVFAGNEERWKYVLGDPPEDDDDLNRLSPGDGSAGLGVVEKADRWVAEAVA